MKSVLHESICVRPGETISNNLPDQMTVYPIARDGIVDSINTKARKRVNTKIFSLFLAFAFFMAMAGSFPAFAQVANPPLESFAIFAGGGGLTLDGNDEFWMGGHTEVTGNIGSNQDLWLNGGPVSGYIAQINGSVYVGGYFKTGDYTVGKGTSKQEIVVNGAGTYSAGTAEADFGGLLYGDMFVTSTQTGLVVDLQGPLTGNLTDSSPASEGVVGNVQINSPSPLNTAITPGDQGFVFGSKTIVNPTKTFATITLPAAKDLTGFTITQGNQTIPDNPGTLTLAPNTLITAYGNVVANNQNETLILSSGDYYFNSLDAGGGFTLKIDLSTGNPIKIYVLNNVSLNLTTLMVKGAGTGGVFVPISNAQSLAALIYLETQGTFLLGPGGLENSHIIWGGTVYASSRTAGEALVDVGQYVDWYGAAWSYDSFTTADHGKWVRVPLEPENPCVDAGENGTLTICEGETVTESELFTSLGGTPDAGGSWTPTLAGAGTYTYTHAATGECPEVSADVVVTEQPALDPGTNGTLTICEGETVTESELFTSLGGIPDAGGAWTPTLAGAGTYTYTHAATGECPEVSADVVVTEQPALDPGTNGTLTICEGETVTESELFTSLGGIPDAGGTWTPTLAGAGTYTYTHAATGECPEVSADVVVTEQPALDPGTNGTLTICEGETVTESELFTSLGGTPDAGGSWTPTLAGAGTYTYTHAATGECPEVSADVVVTEQPALDPGTNGTLTICEGETVTESELFTSLGGTPDAGGSWTPTLAGAGTYTYTHAATGECPEVSADVVVTEQPVLDAGENGTLTICEGETVTADDLYAALLGSPETGGTWSPAITGTSGAGTYTYTHAAVGECPADSADVVVTEQAAPVAPTVDVVAADCDNAGTASITNYDAAVTYTFAPTGPSVDGSGNITGFTTGQAYTVTATNAATCTSVPSAPFTVEDALDCQYGCTYTIGYWKTHSQLGPAPYDATWSLLEGGLEEQTIFFKSNKTYYDVFWTDPKGNAYYILAIQYIGAELNFLHGSEATDAQEAFADAQILFNTYTPAQVKAMKKNSPIRQKFISLAATLDDYNNGVIGPRHCEDEIILTNKSSEIAKAIEPAIEPVIEPVVEFAVLKVYPNPFTDILRFNFVSPESVNARIDLFDMNGRMIKTIFEKPIEAGVNYEAEFIPENIMSAIYFYRVTMGNEIFRGKVVRR